MAYTVIDRFIETAKAYPGKVAFVDSKSSLNYSELLRKAEAVASALMQQGVAGCPVAVFMEKGVDCIPSYLGALMSGNFYSPIDVEMPQARVRTIFDTLKPAAVITNRKFAEEFDDTLVLTFEDMLDSATDAKAVEARIGEITSKDPAYVLFTSGSTGIPKGVVVSHGALLDFTQWAIGKYGFTSETTFGNQVPFYFSMSIWDIYITVCVGASCHIIDPQLFMFPVELMKYLLDNRIDTLVWVPSALTCVVNLKGLKLHHNDSLKQIFFGGEVMPIKKLGKWIEAYPDVRYTNIYGPTEVTDTFMAYTLDRKFDETESLPLGEVRSNHQIMILDGELCVRGAGLAEGYYNNPEQTAKVFVQNPNNTAYPDIIYRTGDLVKYNDRGQLVYVARKDYQIKHMGHRIELGEIETALSSLDGIDESCCLYDHEHSKIVAFFTGRSDERTVMLALQEFLPEYMLPNVRKHLDVMPHNLNGKIDRAALKKNL